MNQSLRVILALLFLCVGKILAGPPFRTDDPIPVPYLHGELYLFSTGTIDATGTSGIGPAVEFNYGVFPEHAISYRLSTVAFDAPKGETS